MCVCTASCNEPKRTTQPKPTVRCQLMTMKSMERDVLKLKVSLDLSTSRHRLYRFDLHIALQSVRVCLAVANTEHTPRRQQSIGCAWILSLSTSALRSTCQWQYVRCSVISRTIDGGQKLCVGLIEVNLFISWVYGFCVMRNHKCCQQTHTHTHSEVTKNNDTSTSTNTTTKRMNKFVCCAHGHLGHLKSTGI